jgi:MFS family permease
MSGANSASTFHRSEPLVGTLEAFAVYAVDFVARPVGAAIFGHYGDRHRTQIHAHCNPDAHGHRDVSGRWCRPMKASASGALSSPHRAQEDVHAGRGDGRRVWLHLFRHAQYRFAVLIFLAIVISLIPHDMMYGPQAALIAESFTGRLRYSGASLGYQLASVIVGGSGAADHLAVPPVRCGLRGRLLHSCLRRPDLVATSMMTDYTGKNIEGEYE